MHAPPPQPTLPLPGSPGVFHLCAKFRTGRFLTSFHLAVELFIPASPFDVGFGDGLFVLQGLGLAPGGVDGDGLSLAQDGKGGEAGGVPGREAMRWRQGDERGMTAIRIMVGWV